MSPLAKVFTIINIVLSLAFFGSTASLFATRVNWRQKALEFKEEADKELARLQDLYSKQGGRLLELDKQFATLNTNYNTVSTEKANLQTNLTAKEGDLASANVRIDSEVKRNTQLLGTKQDLEKQISELNNRLDTTRKDAEEAKQSQEKALAEMTRFRLDLDKLNAEHSKGLIELTEVQEKLSTAELQLGVVAKAGIQVEPLLTGIAPPINAVIQAVKPQDKLVVLSVGRDQKVQEGFKFTVYRNDKFIGKVQVIKVYEDLCGARVLFTANENKEKIQVGDKAATQL